LFVSELEEDDEWKDWEKMPPPMTYDERMEKRPVQKQKAEEKGGSRRCVVWGIVWEVQWTIRRVCTF
jgi:hypothetical protein